MTTKKLIHCTILLVAMMTAYQGNAASPNYSGNTVNKLFKRTTNSSSTRPRIPALTDYLEYTTAGSTLQIFYPDEAFPATMTVTDRQSGFLRYSTTVLNDDPVDLFVEPGEYTLTVTLVDDRTYEGDLIVE